jgi:hypothetical protein
MRSYYWNRELVQAQLLSFFVGQKLRRVVVLNGFWM